MSKKQAAQLMLRLVDEEQGFYQNNNYPLLHAALEQRGYRWFADYPAIQQHPTHLRNGEAGLLCHVGATLTELIAPHHCVQRPNDGCLHSTATMPGSLAAAATLAELAALYPWQADHAAVRRHVRAELATLRRDHTQHPNFCHAGVVLVKGVGRIVLHLEQFTGQLVALQVVSWPQPVPLIANLCLPLAGRPALDLLDALLTNLDLDDFSLLQYAPERWRARSTYLMSRYDYYGKVAAEATIPPGGGWSRCRRCTRHYPAPFAWQRNLAAEQGWCWQCYFQKDATEIHRLSCQTTGWYDANWLLRHLQLSKEDMLPCPICDPNHKLISLLGK